MKHKILIISAIVGILFLLGAGAYYFHTRSFSSEAPTEPMASTTPKETPTYVATSTQFITFMRMDRQHTIHVGDKLGVFSVSSIDTTATPEQIVNGGVMQKGLADFRLTLTGSAQITAEFHDDDYGGRLYDVSSVPQIPSYGDIQDISSVHVVSPRTSFCVDVPTIPFPDFSEGEKRNLTITKIIYNFTGTDACYPLVTVSKMERI